MVVGCLIHGDCEFEQLRADFQVRFRRGLAVDGKSDAVALLTRNR